MIIYLSFSKNKSLFNYQFTISTTKPHGLEHCCFHGQADLYRLYRLWQMSRQIWPIFSVPKRLRILGCETQVFKKDDNKDFRLVENLTMGESDFKQFMRLRNQLVIAAENFAESKLCPLNRYQQCPKTWMKNSNWLPGWLTFWIVQTERYAWFCVTMWISQRVHKLKLDYLQERWRKICFNKLIM